MSGVELILAFLAGVVMGGALDRFRADSHGPSATAYIDRDGTIVRAIDPAKYAAWSQGDVAHPNTKLPTIAAAVASGVNMNEWVHESIECSGAGTEPYTDAQFEAVAHLVAAASKALGIPVNRSTVVVHADINSVSRRSDPWPPATREQRVKRVIGDPGRHRGGPGAHHPEPGEPGVVRDGYLRGSLPRTPTARQVDVLAAFVATGGSVSEAAALVGIRPSTAKRHLADLRARSGPTTEQLIYRGRAQGWLSMPALEPPHGGFAMSTRTPQRAGVAF